MTTKQPPSFALDWLIWLLRWPVLGIAYLIILLAPPRSEDPTQVYILGAGVLFNLIISALLFLKWFPSPLPTVTIIIDTVLIIALLVVTGGENTPKLLQLFPLALFPVITAAVRFGLEACLLATAPAVLALVAIAFLPVMGGGAADPLKLLTDLGPSVGLFFGTAVLVSLLSDWQKESQREGESGELKELRTECDRAKIMYEMASTVNATLNYRRVLEAILDPDVLGPGELGEKAKSIVAAIFLYESAGEVTRMSLEMGRNLPTTDERRRISGEKGLICRAIDAAEPVLGGDLSKDPELSDFVAFRRCLSAICAPLRAGFDTFGVIIFSSPEPNLFTEQHCEVLTMFCNQATIAMQNAQLYQSLQQEKEKILDKEAETRKKLARDLHDGPTQAVAAIAMRLNFTRMLIEQDPTKVSAELQKIEELARKTTQEIRTMLFTLRPLVLETKGVTAAIHQYADKLRETDKLNIILDVDSYDGRLSAERENVVFSVVEEAVGNAKKHAKPEHIWIRLSVQQDMVVAEIQDDGEGFDLKEVQRSYERRGSLGLINMRERAELVNGDLSIESAVGKGTTVRLLVPVQGG
jgi:signal transduction histidine kinase